MSRFGATAVVSSTAPVPVTFYKPAVPGAVTSLLTRIKDTVNTIKNKAMLIAAQALEFLNYSRIRSFISTLVQIRNTIMNAVMTGMAWAKAAIDTVVGIVSSVVAGVRSLTETLNALIKQNAIYKLASSLCGGFNFDGVAKALDDIKLAIDFKKVLDYALDDFDKDLFNNIKNCKFFDKESVKNVKSAFNNMTSKSNLLMLDAMKDTFDYWDIKNVDRKLAKATQFMNDDYNHREAMDNITKWMGLEKDLPFVVQNPKFGKNKVYIVETTSEYVETVPNYVDDAIGRTNRDLLVAAAQFI